MYCMLSYYVYICLVVDYYYFLCFNICQMYMFYMHIHVFFTNTFFPAISYMLLQMPRQRKSTYLPPGCRGTRGSPAGSSSTPASHATSPLVGYDIGGSSSQSQVPETPPAYTAHAPGDYPLTGVPT